MFGGVSFSYIGTCVFQDVAEVDTTVIQKLAIAYNGGEVERSDCTRYRRTHSFVPRSEFPFLRPLNATGEENEKDLEKLLLETVNYEYLYRECRHAISELPTACKPTCFIAVGEFYPDFNRSLLTATPSTSYIAFEYANGGEISTKVAEGKVRGLPREIAESTREQIPGLR